MQRLPVGKKHSVRGNPNTWLVVISYTEDGQSIWQVVLYERIGPLTHCTSIITFTNKKNTCRAHLDTLASVIQTAHTYCLTLTALKDFRCEGTKDG